MDSGRGQEEAGEPADCRAPAEKGGGGRKGLVLQCIPERLTQARGGPGAQGGRWRSWGSPRNSLGLPPCCAWCLSGSSPGKQDPAQGERRGGSRAQELGLSVH